MRVIDYYDKRQDEALSKTNEKIKGKGIKKNDLVLRYNSKLDKTFQKKFQIKWEGPFRVMDCFANGTYHLVHLDEAPMVFMQVGNIESSCMKHLN